ncbi:MAG: hypothetical protein ACI9VN_000425, partial [Patescibacteria group bacterium]
KSFWNGKKNADCWEVLELSIRSHTKTMVKLDQGSS